MSSYTKEAHDQPGDFNIAPRGEEEDDIGQDACRQGEETAALDGAPPSWVRVDAGRVLDEGVDRAGLGGALLGRAGGVVHGYEG